jgi:hypothetical protein
MLNSRFAGFDPISGPPNHVGFYIQGWDAVLDLQNWLPRQVEEE